jgi:hypothetical protein
VLAAATPAARDRRRFIAVAARAGGICEHACCAVNRA